MTEQTFTSPSMAGQYRRWLDHVANASWGALDLRDVDPLPYLLNSLPSGIERPTSDTSQISDREDFEVGTRDRPSERSSHKPPEFLPPITVEPIQITGEWEGIVEQISGSTFIARITDLRGHRPDELAEFDYDDTATDDRPLIVPGGLFYWSIFRVTKGTGRIRTLL